MVDPLVDAMVEAMQLIGSLMAIGLGTAAVVWYVILWPFDRAAR